MSEDTEEKDDAIHRVATVPPPPGEGDAYSAPTAVGPINDAVIDAMRKAGVPEDLIPSRPPNSSGTPSPPVAELARPLPRAYDARVDDEGPTLLNPSASKIALTPMQPVVAQPATLPAPALEPSRDWGRVIAMILLVLSTLVVLAAFLISLR